MEIAFADDDLDRLETDPAFTAGFGQAVVKAYRKRIQQIRAATDERTFYALKSLHFEKLKGDREGATFNEAERPIPPHRRTERERTGKGGPHC